MLFYLSYTDRESLNHLRLLGDGHWSRNPVSTSAHITYLIQVVAQLSCPVAGRSVLDEGLSFTRDTFDEVGEA